MKVFEFDPTTGKKGKQIDDIPVPQGFLNRERVECVLPKWYDAEWMVATSATDRNNKPVTFDRPVCFCLGKFRCGMDEHWEWVALLPKP